jgi:hypothetical protein
MRLRPPPAAHPLQVDLNAATTLVYRNVAERCTAPEPGRGGLACAAFAHRLANMSEMTQVR